MGSIIKTGLPENGMENNPNGTAMSEDEYLKRELVADIKHEYIDGQIYAMSGASNNHSRIAANMLREIGNHLKGKPCEAFMADTKVKVGKDYFYPDVIVDCGTPSMSDHFASLPVMIIEVLSTSTRKVDTSTKLPKYLNIPTLKEYVLIEQDVVSIEVPRNSNAWRTEYYSLGDSVLFESIGLTLTALEIYGRVDNREIIAFRQAQLALAAKLAEQQRTTGS
jgi:Uma2 family endonuclease